MREVRQVNPPLQLQVAHPPDWLPEAHTAADLGSWAPRRTDYFIVTALTRRFCCVGRFGYHFPHPKQEEDILTEANVKDGLHLPTPVAVRPLPYRFPEIFWGSMSIRPKHGERRKRLGDAQRSIQSRSSRTS
jgi:hypothetical protein